MEHHKHELNWVEAYLGSPFHLVLLEQIVCELRDNILSTDMGMRSRKQRISPFLSSPHLPYGNWQSPHTELHVLNEAANVFMILCKLFRQAFDVFACTSVTMHLAFMHFAFGKS
jgi:hypothetical protein